MDFNNKGPRDVSSFNPLENNSRTRIPEIRIFSPSRHREISKTAIDVNGASLSSTSTSTSKPAAMIPWNKTHDMRMVNLANFPLTCSAYRNCNSSKGNTLVSRSKASVTASSTKALNLLRISLQKSLNKELDAVLQKYLDTFFKPAVDNIRKNNGDNSISEYHLQAVCRQALDEAKKMYFVGNQLETASVGTRSSPQRFSPHLMNLMDVNSDTESNPELKRRRGRITNNSSNCLFSDNESDFEGRENRKRKANGVKKLKTNGRSTPLNGIDKSGHRWDPDRLNTNVKFVLGSKANKSLGFGLTRGRLYTKHPEIFRYIGDMEDRQWLSERGLMPPAGGRAYLIIKEDIEYLMSTDEYRGASGVNPLDMGEGFLVPQFMIEKMKVIMESSRTGKKACSRPSSRNNQIEDQIEEEDHQEEVSVEPTDETTSRQVEEH